MSRRWHDLWMDEVVELLVGCVLLVVSGSWWFHTYGAVWSSWYNVLLSAATVLGPYFVGRAWRRRGEERDEAARLALKVMSVPGVTELVARDAVNERDQRLRPGAELARQE
jgi:hypothetical protein